MTESLHILYVSEGFPPETDARPMRVFQHAAAWVKAGHCVSVLTKTPNHPFGRPYQGYHNRWHEKTHLEGIEVHRVWSWLMPNTTMLKRMAAAASFAVSAVWHSRRIVGVDVVIATSPTPLAALAGYVISRIKQVPFVFEVRDLWPESLQGHGYAVTGRLLRGLVRFLYRRAALVVCVTQGQKSVLQQSYGLPSENVHLAPNGADLALFQVHGLREAYRSRLGWDEKFVVIFAGNHGDSHHLALILDVAEAVRDKTHILFVLMGEGSRKTALECSARERGLRQVVFYEQQPNASIPGWYEAADLCFIPLHAHFPYDHAMPLKLYESMAMGLPVLLAGKGEAADMVSRSGAGRCVAPGDTQAAVQILLDLSRDPKKGEALKQPGPAFIAAHYSRKAIALDMLHIMETLCHNVR